jgi:serine/threonine-protein kinase
MSAGGHLVGRTLGGYEILERLGEGGMGAVYKARDAALERFVAIKTLAPALEADPTCVERFQREARTIARLRHPNLMHIYAVGEEGGVHFFVMEHIAGEPLSRRLARGGPLALDEAARIAGQVMSGLHRVHAAGVVHRDLKPGNVMLDADGRAILVDFGLSRSEETAGLTASGAILGTPDYMAPEQIEGEPLGAFTDIYALGILVYEMLSGIVPFRRKTAAQTLRAHCEEDPPSLAHHRSDVPAPLQRILDRAMAREPAARYASLPELAADLLAVARTPELEALAAELTAPGDAHTRALPAGRLQPDAASPAPHGADPAPRPAGRAHLGRGVLVAAGAVGLLLLGAFLARGRPETPPAPPTSPAPGASRAGDAHADAPVYVPDGATAIPEGVPRPPVFVLTRGGDAVRGVLVEADGETLVVERIDGTGRRTIPLSDVRAVRFLRPGDRMPGGRRRTPPPPPGNGPE